MKQLKMRLLVILLCAFMVVTAAKPKCDPETQYEDKDQCCMMCGPGTSMSDRGTCQIPHCPGCKDNEYQDKHTHESKCQLQPYCDPNKNFMISNHHSRTARTICTCKIGFHCSSEECITCVAHKVCGPGHEVKFRGNQTHDLVCQKCPEGTFSINISGISVCQKWTECGDGYDLAKKGTDQSDNVCEKTTRIHIVMISVVAIFVLIVISVGLYCHCRGNIKDSLKGCVESCHGEDQKDPPREIYKPIHDTEHILKEQYSTQEENSTQEGHGMTPEENLDEESLEQSSCPRTENGNFVTQERGKSEVLSRQESQTQTFIDSL